MSCRGKRPEAVLGNESWLWLVSSAIGDSSTLPWPPLTLWRVKNRKFGLFGMVEAKPHDMSVGR